MSDQPTLVPDHALPTRPSRNESLDRNLIATRCTEAIESSRKTIPAIAAECSVSVAAINGVMAGRSLPSLALVMKLSLATRVTVGWLSGEEISTPPATKTEPSKLNASIQADVNLALGHAFQTIMGLTWLFNETDSRWKKLDCTAKFLETVSDRFRAQTRPEGGAP